MRANICRPLFIIATCLLSGCTSNSTTNSPTPAADKAADTKAFVMQSAGANVLKLTAPVDIKCVAADNSLHFTAAKYEVEFWMVSGAKTVDDAVLRVPTQIVSEFKDFKAKTTTDITIAGSPAKRLVGPGHEADDGDPGYADVIVFKVGTHIFVACNHGEVLSEVGQQALLTLTQSAQLP